MVVDTTTYELKFVRRADGLELDLPDLQGLWTEEQYLRLTDETSYLIEFTDGEIEVLPVPTDDHQAILLLLYERFKQRVGSSGGVVRVSGLRVRIRSRAFREPDVVLLRDKRDARRQKAYWLGADLVVEVVSPDRPERDTVEKRREYAAAGIPEYWIVNPLDETITVLTLQGDTYAVHGTFRRGDRASSRLLEGFEVTVDDVLDAP